METISFARGVPPPEALPVEELADCARAAIGRDGRTALNYGPVAGYQPLREWIAERHRVEPGRVVVTNGSLQGFVFLASRLASRGHVLVEAPTYDRPLAVLAGLEADIAAIPLTDGGLDLDVVERVVDGAAFLYTIPSFQNPSGRTLPLEQRRRLAELARSGRLLVLEDDPYGLVRFEGEVLPTIFELAGGEGVVYSSSFSKTVAPGLRAGYLVLPPDLEREVEAAAVSTYISPVYAAQATVFEFLRRGNLEPNLVRVRALLRERRDAMLAALEHELGGSASWNRPEGGYFLWLDFPEGTDAADLQRRAEEAGVAFVKGADFFPSGADGASSARLAFSFAQPAAIAEGVSRLASVLPVSTAL